MIQNQPEPLMQSALMQSIKRAVQEEIELEYERLKKEVVERLDRRKDEVVAGVLISVMKTVQVNTMDDKIVFTIHKQS
jgi:hypothetical protein